MMNVVGVGRDRQRPNIKRGWDAGGDCEACPQMVAGGLRVNSAGRVILFDPWDVDGAEKRRREETDRDDTDDKPDLVVSRQIRLA